jgi:NADPH:quinone reductase-like Zn-dependent oxidoreductase
MRAAVITAQVSGTAPVASVVKVVSDFPDPPPPANREVRVRTLCSALNHLDLWVGKGVPGLSLTYPRIGGSDACGVVESVGPNVDGAWVGKRVILNAAVVQAEPYKPLDPPEPGVSDIAMIGEHVNGAHCQFFNAPVSNVQAIRDNQDPADAAAFGLTFLTAYSMMIGKAGLKPGQWVLITGIGGGVATAALAIAKAWSCRAIVTSRHQWKLDRARELGADEVILDNGEDWSQSVRKTTGGRGVDIAVDSTGKATHLKCIKSLARGGAYVTPGATSGPDAVTDLTRIFWNQLRVLGSTMGTNEEFAQVAALYRDGALKPVVDKVYKADQTAEAYARLEAGEQFGKIVIDWR